MQYSIFSTADRGKKNVGWLKSNFVFSFSNYYHPLKSAFGTLMAFNDDHMEPGKGFGIHPHINMEIISVLLKGKVNHKDSMGYSSVIEEGGVQIMGPEHCWINQNARLSLGYFEKGRQIQYAFNPENKCIFIFQIEGDMLVNDIELQKRNAIGVWETDQIFVDCKDNSEFLIIETPVNQK